MVISMIIPTKDCCPNLTEYGGQSLMNLETVLSLFIILIKIDYTPCIIMYSDRLMGSTCKGNQHIINAHV